MRAAAATRAGAARAPALGAPGRPAARRAAAAARRPAALPDLLAAVHPVLAALDLDWSDPDTQIGGFAAVVGVGLGLGVPIFYISRTERDEERLEELRELNRATKAATGEYLSDDEIQAIRPKRWTDGREFVDDD